MHDPKERFTLTADHIKLLRRAYVRWEDCEFGAPAIDCKRPYGNSNVPGDIAEILGWDVPEDEDAWEGEWYERARTVHAETETALQVILDSGSFEPGTYERVRYYGTWARVG